MSFTVQLEIMEHANCSSAVVGIKSSHVLKGPLLVGFDKLLLRFKIQHIFHEAASR